MHRRSDILCDDAMIAAVARTLAFSGCRRQSAGTQGWASCDAGTEEAHQEAGRGM